MSTIFTDLATNMNKLFPIAETFGLCVFQVVMLLLTILLVYLLVRLARKHAIVVDRILQNGSYWKWVLGIGLVLVVILSLIVWVHHFIKCELCTTDALDNTRYSAFQDVSQYFFGVQVSISDLKGEYISSMLVGLIKVFLFNGIVIATMVGLFNRRIQSIRSGEVRYKEKSLQNISYAVVIGSNEVASSIVRNLLRNNGQKTRDHYVILHTSMPVKNAKTVLSSHLMRSELQHVIFYHGLRDSLDEMRDLHLEDATEIFILGEHTSWDKGETYHDAMNMRCLNLIIQVLEEIHRKKTLPRKKCSVLFEYHTTSSVFQFSDINENVKNKLIEFIPFNRHEEWAKNVFVRLKAQDLIDCDSSETVTPISYEPLDGGKINPTTEKHVHLVIVGMSKMGVALAIQALYQAHYPNIKEYPNQRTRITFIDTNADKEMAFFKGRYSTLFELAINRYIDTTKNESYDKEWVDPVQKNAQWQHLTDSEEKRSFLDVEIEFIKGSLESDGVRTILSEISKDDKAILTIAICLTQTHQSVAASLYMPIDVYKNENLQQILVNQPEASDIVTNLSANMNHIRYGNLRPFGMLFADYIASASDIYKSMLVNWAYEKKPWPKNINEMSDVVEAWNRLKISSRYSNINYADSIEQKLRCVWNTIEVIPEFKNVTDIFANDDVTADNIQSTLERAIQNNDEALAICEHNRWNLQQLLLGFTPCDLKEDTQLIKLVAEGNMDEVKRIKSNLKSSYERVHPNICDYDHLAKVDPDAQPYDADLNATIPRILMLVDGAGKWEYKEK